MFKLDPNPTFTTPVQLSVPGLPKPLIIQVEFRHFDTDQLEVYYDALPGKSSAAGLAEVIGEPAGRRRRLQRRHPGQAAEEPPDLGRRIVQRLPPRAPGVQGKKLMAAARVWATGGAAGDGIDGDDLRELGVAPEELEKLQALYGEDRNEAAGEYFGVFPENDAVRVFCALETQWRRTVPPRWGAGC